ncbi:RHS repeat-associated core domain-containing protein [Nocardioides sp. InS609-2]|uniref:RHS repeat domain-containing protein n=1 Tax=Nocardioides sp. InS609-2 TaxID=2760705 RepID=UPI0020BE67B7|nr:RHS repeat-associated core domain-containing protein [Nocardioides sp. InS609-2]
MTTNDHVNPLVDYDYNARGQQRYRRAGTADPEYWTFNPDGTMAEHRDRRKDGVGGQRTTFSYNADNQLTTALDGAGITSPNAKPVEIALTYDALGRTTLSRFRSQGATNYTTTATSYDLNSNVTRRIDDATQTPTGTELTAGTRHDYTYDAADRFTTQLDHLPEGCQKIDTTYTPAGMRATQVTARARATQSCTGTPAYTVKQSTAWEYFHNRLPQTLTTRSGPLETGTLKERHVLDYTNAAGIYLNGNRARDTFTIKGNSNPCSTTDCAAAYTYDGQDRLTQEQRSSGPTISYQLDAPGNLIKKTTLTAITNQEHQEHHEYDGMQLVLTAVGAATNYVSRHHYDAEGNVDCVTIPTYTGACPPDGSALLADYSYDYLNRLSSYASYSNETVVDESSYEYDPLDRITTQIEKHPSTPQRTSTFTYLGLSDQVTKEAQSGDASRDATKTYSYDASGQRVSMTNDPNNTDPTETLTYGYDPHGSVSMLLDATGTTKATYGYDAYGNADQDLTVGDAADDNILNPYRYTAKRLDTGTSTLNMGARHFSPTTSRFLTPDSYSGALDNLGLSTDPLTSNRYALAAGNPLNNIEVDGHRPIQDNGDEVETHLPYNTGSSGSGGGASSTSSSTVGRGGDGSSGVGGGRSVKERIGPDEWSALEGLALSAFQQLSVAFSAAHLASAASIMNSRHNADPKYLQNRKVEVNTRSGKGLGRAAKGLGVLGGLVTLQDELTRETEVEVSKKERVADAGIQIGAGGIASAGAAAVGAGFCVASVVCGVGVGVGAILFGGVVGYSSGKGLHANDGWLTGDHEDDAPLDPFGVLGPGHG